MWRKYGRNELEPKRVSGSLPHGMESVFLRLIRFVCAAEGGIRSDWVRSTNAQEARSG